MPSDRSMEKNSPSVVEACASDVVGAIKEFIDALRTEFPLTRTTTNSKDASVEGVLLYTRLKEKGLLQTVKALYEKQEERLGKNKFAIMFGQPNTTEPVDERRQLRQHILLPLICLLAQCYDILDHLPASQSQEDQQATSKKNKKPVAPIGMLSIQNYTDIACLLEFTIVAGILPELEPNVLMKSEDRIRYYLPKAMAGRIPRASLAWGASFPSEMMSGSKRRLSLLQTVSAMASLLLLDRFKPMLLPRHLSDTYGALFQAEQWTDSSDRHADEELQDLYTKLGLTQDRTMDPSLQAKAYQVLLLQGTKAPDWLRRRVSQLLAQLACTNLAAIIQVFCPVQETSSASQRLGRALATAPSKKLSQQMRQLLQLIFPSNGELPAPAMAILETVWAVLNQWSSNVIEEHVIQVWEKTIMGSESQSNASIHATIRQIGALCSLVPNPTNSLKVLQLIPRSLIFRQLVRLASMPSVLAGSARDDAKQCLHWISQAIYGIKQATDGPKATMTPQTLLVTAWIHSMAPCAWDKGGHRYRMIESATDASIERSSNSLDTLEVQQSEVGTADLRSITESCSRRAEVYFEATNSPSSTRTRMSGLHSRMFRLLLEVYLSASAKEPVIVANYQFVSLLVLPLLFEKCSTEDLLFGDTGDGMELLSLVQVVLRSVERKLGDHSSNHVIEDSSHAGLVVEHGGMVTFIDELESVFGDMGDDSLLSGSEIDQSEASLSIASIVLSLLISVLELGSKLRSTSEEEKLRSLLPSLKSLAALNIECGKVGSLSTEESHAGLADMSGYAMVLIASRGVPDEDMVPDPDKSLSPMEKLKRVVGFAEKDLQSTEPPLRARGMVKLGRLARGYLGVLPNESLEKENNTLISELKETDSASTRDDAARFLVQEILRLSMVALSDKESYVYLAAVQTVVAAGDMLPGEVIPVVASAVVTGVLSAKTHVKGLVSSDIEISREQRIKLAEALVFIIRRRAIANVFVSSIFSIMTFGSAERMSDSLVRDKNIEISIRSETHQYFLGEKEKQDENEDGFKTQAEKWAETDIRFRTGGPMFEAEEFDLVRAARASVIAELVSASKPMAVAPYCRFLIRLVVDALTLDSSRAVCRAVALLARELYGCILRELDETLEATNTSTPAEAGITMPFTMAVVSSDDEEVLFSILQVHASGVGDASLRKVDDPATSTRCSEALDLRCQSEESGLLDSCRLALSQMTSNRTPDLLNIVQSKDTPAIRIEDISS
eukprot:scaffold1319_cov126-Cylindrotheca_fusiformis.AAC.29